MKRPRSFRHARLIGQIFERILPARPAKMFHRKVSRSRQKIGSQRSTPSIEATGPPKQAEKTIVRDIFGQRARAEHAIGEAEDSVAMALVQRQKSRFVAATRSFKQPFVCDAFGQLGFVPPRSSGIASQPCITSNLRKDTPLALKILREQNLPCIRAPHARRGDSGLMRPLMVKSVGGVAGGRKAVGSRQ